MPDSPPVHLRFLRSAETLAFVFSQFQAENRFPLVLELL